MAAGATVAEDAANLVRIGYFDKYAPLSRRNEDGTVTGILIDSI